MTYSYEYRIFIGMDGMSLVTNRSADKVFLHLDLDSEFSTYSTLDQKEQYTAGTESNK